MTEAIGSHSPRFLVLRGGAIGDFIATLPALQALRERWPLAEIEIWGYPHVATLAIAGGLAQSVVSLDRAEMARFFVPEPRFTDAQVEAVRSFDVVVNYLHDPVGQVRSNLLLAGARQVLSGSPIVKRGHATSFLLEPLQSLAIYDEGLVPVLDLSGEAHSAGRSLLRALGMNGRPTVLHPGSGGKAKIWPTQRFAEIARRLVASGRETAAVFGEADLEVEHEFVRLAPEVPALKGMALVDLAGALSECGAYVGNDSGITHLAAALGLSVVALFGPSDAEKWGPRGRGDVRIVRSPDGTMEGIGVETVWQAVAGGKTADDP